MTPCLVSKVLLVPWPSPSSASEMISPPSSAARSFPPRIASGILLAKSGSSILPKRPLSQAPANWTARGSMPRAFATLASRTLSPRPIARPSQSKVSVKPRPIEVPAVLLVSPSLPPAEVIRFQPMSRRFFNSPRIRARLVSSIAASGSPINSRFLSSASYLISISRWWSRSFCWTSGLLLPSSISAWVSLLW